MNDKNDHNNEDNDNDHSVRWPMFIYVRVTDANALCCKDKFNWGRVGRGGNGATEVKAGNTEKIGHTELRKIIILLSKFNNLQI